MRIAQKYLITTTALAKLFNSPHLRVRAITRLQLQLDLLRRSGHLLQSVPMLRLLLHKVVVGGLEKGAFLISFHDSYASPSHFLPNGSASEMYLWSSL